MNHHPIGTWVAVHAVAAAACRDLPHRLRRRVYEYPLIAPALGQVVGMTYLYEGTLIPGGCDNSAVLIDRRAVLVYRVSFGVRTRPVHVLPDSLRGPVKPPSGHRLPWAAPALAYAMYGYTRIVREAPRPVEVVFHDA